MRFVVWAKLEQYLLQDVEWHLQSHAIYLTSAHPPRKRALLQGFFMLESGEHQTMLVGEGKLSHGSLGSGRTTSPRWCGGWSEPETAQGLSLPSHLCSGYIQAPTTPSPPNYRRKWLNRCFEQLTLATEPGKLVRSRLRLRICLMWLHYLIAVRVHCLRARLLRQAIRNDQLVHLSLQTFLDTSLKFGSARTPCEQG